MKTKYAINSSTISHSLPDAPEAFVQRMTMMIEHLPKERMEQQAMKKKLSIVLVAAIAFAVLTVGALAAILLSPKELVEQIAVPLAQQNDDGVLRENSYSPEELVQILTVAAENGITLDESSSMMQAMKRGEGYFEDEVLMEICRQAFGGYIMDWTLEERVWYNSMLKEISNIASDIEFPQDGEMTESEAKAVAIAAVEKRFGAQGLSDESQYKTQVVYSWMDDGAVWDFVFRLRSMEGADYQVVFNTNAPENAEIEKMPYSTDTITNCYALRSAIDERLGNGMKRWYTWSQEMWHLFDEMKQRIHSADGLTDDEKGVMETTYPLAEADDLSKDDAVAAACAMVEGKMQSAVLMLDGNARIWKVTVRKADNSVESLELDAKSGILREQRTLEQLDSDAAYYPFATFDAIKRERMTEKEAIDAAIMAVRAQEKSTIPLDDANYFTQTARYNTYADRWYVRFVPKTLEYGSVTVNVAQDGSAKITAMELDAITGDNLFSRFGSVYGSFADWPQENWIALNQQMQAYTPTTLDGRVLKATTYAKIDAATLSAVDAKRIAMTDAGNSAWEAWSTILIDAMPNPVWKVRVLADPSCVLYEIDGKTGEILDKEAFKADNTAFDSTAKIYTLHKTFAALQLEMEGVEPIARNYVVKQYADMAYDIPDEALMDEMLYKVTIEGMTVSYTALDSAYPSFVVTVNEQGLVDHVEAVPGEDGSFDLFPEFG